jgi:capsular exopolysaccharide synthesis family protein
MQKREETNLTIASTPNKARIVVSPQEELAIPTAPKAKIVLLAAIILGLLIPFGIIYLHNLLNTKIQSRNELEKLSNVPVAGEIGEKTAEDGNIVVTIGRTDGVAEMFRTLRNSLNFVFNNDKNKIIVVTSTGKGEGKTFISANLAASYALTGKKILLVGGDIRNPQLKNYFSVIKPIGLTNYLSEEYATWRELVKPTNFNSSLFLMVAGPVPPNPNELLMSPRLKTFLEEAKAEYDLVVIDSAPVGLVSDTYLIDEYVDATLYAVRERVTPRDAVNFINIQKNEEKLKNMYLVLNSSKAHSQHFKYGYGKQYGYPKDK